MPDVKTVIILGLCGALVAAAAICSSAMEGFAEQGGGRGSAEEEKRNIIANEARARELLKRLRDSHH